MLLIGVAGTAIGVFRWMSVRYQEDLLVEPTARNVEEVSAGYLYTPIAKEQHVTDLETGETGLFSSDGLIKVNINSSSLEDLSRLRGVGPSTAIRMLEYRLEKGPFLRVEEMDNVKGIGPKTIEKFGDQAYAGDPEPLSYEMIQKLKQTTESKKNEAKISKIVGEPCGPGRININTAGAEELISLPRIGAKTAERIIADRDANGPFKDVNDLTRVKGIGPKTLEKMKDRICAE